MLQRDFHSLGNCLTSNGAEVEAIPICSSIQTCFVSREAVAGGVRCVFRGVRIQRGLEEAGHAASR
jgi:hypothetical protein